jgi:hypothetical protein
MEDAQARFTVTVSVAGATELGAPGTAGRQVWKQIGYRHIRIRIAIVIGTINPDINGSLRFI